MISIRGFDTSEGASSTSFSTRDSPFSAVRADLDDRGRIEIRVRNVGQPAFNQPGSREELRDLGDQVGTTGHLLADARRQGDAARSPAVLSMHEQADAGSILSERTALEDIPGPDDHELDFERSQVPAPEPRASGDQPWVGMKPLAGKEDLDAGRVFFSSLPQDDGGHPVTHVVHDADPGSLVALPL
jgi:hypothetical protein